jgi:glycerol transport system ATP-binding protein
MLELDDVTRRVGGETHIAGASLRLERGSLNILLGPTLAGKTSLMRLMAGLDHPSSGRVRFEGKDVTGQSVRKRNVAMVYQQFINYPELTVRENIASPLKVQRADKATITREIDRVAEVLKLGPYLDRKPAELSGGQQQRVALARAIVKKADLVLLDEPLANLDYKLREELRTELPKLFAGTNAVVVYATTDPTEALLLGGNTATLHEGRITQFGPTSDVYRNPASLTTAKIFSDPPLNVLKTSDGMDRFYPAASYIAFRPHHVWPGGDQGGIVFDVKVQATEVVGSESFVHMAFGPDRLMMVTHGVNVYPAGMEMKVHTSSSHVMTFDAMQQRNQAPVVSG